MSKLIFGIRRIIPFDRESLLSPSQIYMEFVDAYLELRKACPSGDLHIHFYVEADSAEAVGVKLENGSKSDHSS